MTEDIIIPDTIDKILWGKSIVEINTDGDLPLVFILRSLSIREVNYIDFIYKRELRISKQSGLISRADMEELFRANGIWTQQDEKRIEEVKLLIKLSEKDLQTFEFIKQKKKHAESTLKLLTAELSELTNRKEQLFCNSAESRAEEVKRRYIVWKSTENMQEQQYWSSEEDFLDETNHTLIFDLAIAYYKHNIFDEKTMRILARSPQWRYRWKMAKCGADLFGKPICEWSEMQNMLVYWSQYYDYIFESPDSPDDRIINNDKLCDGWVEEQNKKYSKKTSTPSSKLNNKTNKHDAHQEQFIMVEKGDTDAIKQVQEMNAPAVRAKLRNEYSTIKKSKGRISEWQLRKGRLPNGEYATKER